MAKPLEGGIARELYRGFKQARMLRAVTLVRPVSSLRVPGQASGGTNPQPETWQAKGFVSTTRRERIGGTLVGTQSRVVSVLGYGLATDPRAGDKVTVDGVESRVLSVEVDAARAMFTLLTQV